MLEVKVMKAFGYTICYYSLVIDMHGFTCNTFQISWLLERSNGLINRLIVSLTHNCKSPKVLKTLCKDQSLNSGTSDCMALKVLVKSSTFPKHSHS
jgi:hypothetical protein